jgi:hypothetical protein
VTLKMARTDGCQQSRVVQRFNVCFKRGHLVNSIDVQFMSSLSSLEIEWVWSIEECRRATPEEIRRLCHDLEI